MSSQGSRPEPCPHAVDHPGFRIAVDDRDHGSLARGGLIRSCNLAPGGAPGTVTRSAYAADVALHLVGGGGRDHRPERVGRDAPEEHLAPDSPAGPALEALLDRVRLAEPLRQVLPRCP